MMVLRPCPAIPAPCGRWPTGWPPRASSSSPSPRRWAGWPAPTSSGRARRGRPSPRGHAPRPPCSSLWVAATACPRRPCDPSPLPSSTPSRWSRPRSTSTATPGPERWPSGNARVEAEQSADPAQRAAAAGLHGPGGRRARAGPGRRTPACRGVARVPGGRPALRRWCCTTSSRTGSPTPAPTTPSPASAGWPRGWRARRARSRGVPIPATKAFGVVEGAAGGAKVLTDTTVKVTYGDGDWRSIGLSAAALATGRPSREGAQDVARWRPTLRRGRRRPAPSGGCCASEHRPADQARGRHRAPTARPRRGQAPVQGVPADPRRPAVLADGDSALGCRAGRGAGPARGAGEVARRPRARHPRSGALATHAPDRLRHRGGLRRDSSGADRIGDLQRSHARARRSGCATSGTDSGTPPVHCRPR